ncbi:hypothetical protein JCM16303_005893 [Sporobolomyces ruberrimus]
MPPRPRGLRAAAKRSAPSDDSSAPENSNPSNDEPVPLDDNCLTLPDLFELRLNVLDILYQYPTDLFISQTDSEKLDEARALLRGILHGTAVLEPYVVKALTTSPEEHEKGERGVEKVEARREEAGEDKMKALGLEEGRHLNDVLLCYLQGWSLLHLGEIFQDPKEEIKASAVKLGGGAGGGAGPATKKRKLDFNEPQTKIEWLEAADWKNRIARQSAMQNFDGMDDEEEPIRISLVFGDRLRIKAALARCHFEAGYEEKGHEYAKECGFGRGDDFDADGTHNSINADINEITCAEAILAQLRAWADQIAFFERYPKEDREGFEHTLAEPSPEGDKDLWELELIVNRVLESGDDDEGVTGDLERMEAQSRGKAPEQVQLLKWLKEVVIADAKMVGFIKMEDAIEAKYRADAEDDEEGEGEVQELPTDADDVKLVKKKGEEVVAALRKTITDFASLPASVAHPSGKDAQYRKLEEILLISSALVNPSDKEGTAKIEAEIEKVRKEGGLDVQDETEEGPQDKA